MSLKRGGVMQQPEVMIYADIAEVRTETRAAACNQLLAEGWVLLGIYPLTRVAEMTQGKLVETGSGNSARTRSSMSGA
jgi:hypothetical protein